MNKFEIKTNISCIVEANNSHDAKRIFMQGYDVGYLTRNMIIAILDEDDPRKPMNTVLNEKLKTQK